MPGPHAGSAGMATMSAARRLQVLGLAFTVACQEPPNLLSGLTAPEQILVLRYLDCIDCIIPLDSVRALASRNPEATVDSLNTGLLKGPDTLLVKAADSVLAIGYVRDSTWRVNHGLLMLLDRVTYVSQARERWVNGYRSRGAYGMGWIHTPRAVAHLDSAATLTMPPSVKQAVLYARDSLPPP